MCNIGIGTERIDMKFSIIVPIYNIEKYLSECLDSLLQQTYAEWEAILVDDGSTDKSGEICDIYGLKDSRFCVIHKKNGGSGSAKNIALDYVTGDYVGFVDGDDYVERTWLENMAKIINDIKPDIIEFNFDKIYLNQIKKNADSCIKSQCTAEEYLAQYITNWTSSLFWNKIFSVHLIKNIRFRKERRCIDDEFFTYKVISNADNIVHINDIFYHYRQRKSSIVRSKINAFQITEDALDVLIERYKWICDKFPNLRSIYLSHDVNSMFYFINFNYTKRTIKKFRKISRFYLIQTILHKVSIQHLKNTIQLQFVSKKLLLKKQYNTEKNISILFE